MSNVFPESFGTLDQYILTEQSPAYSFVIAILEYIQPDRLEYLLDL